VYVHTSALPEWVEAEKRLVDIDSWITQKNGMRKVIEAIQDLDGWKTREWKVSEIAERVSISARSAREHLKTLVEQGYLTSRTAGRGGAFHFSNVCLEEAGKYGHVDFPE
jgi:DNA-binding transcriptional ArsR family regulator